MNLRKGGDLDATDGDLDIEWTFDKRLYSELPPPRNLDGPPAGGNNALIEHLIYAFNEASNHIPGWDEFARTGVATQLWNGELTL